MADFSLDDIDSMINEASQGYDFSNYFSGDTGASFDLGQLDPNALSFDDLNSLIDTTAIENMDLGSLNLQDLGLEGLRGYEDLNAGDLAALEDMGASYWKDLYSSGLTPEQEAARQELLSSLPAQDFGGADTTKYMGEYDKNLKEIADKGGYTSDFQNVEGRKVKVFDDGTGIAINPTTGATKSLSQAEVQGLVDSGKLNTYKSGYNEATGGNKVAPGGGVQVILKDGTRGTLLTSGNVIDDKGTVVGKKDDVKTTITPGTTVTPGGVPVVTKGSTTQQKSGIESILPLLLMLLAMNKSGGSSGASNATIPSLGASRSQTPYSSIQQGAGYRPGQGGITYFTPMQYMKGMGMAEGGIAGLDQGRLLEGPGDGVSDSIPAVIGGMAGGGQPARLARGEYVIDARTVAALGNGSTDAGAERLDEMRRKILADDRKAGVGKDSKAYRHLKA